MNTQQLLALADRIKTICEVEDYHANLLDTVSVNENTHSRILRLLLGYYIDGSYPFYTAFLKINSIAKVLPPQFKVGKPEFVNEWARIDLLIKAPDYAIIIENKVYDADDQDTQLERYIDFCLKRGYNQNQIYVLYLTKDGTKTVADWSLTDKAKGILKMGEESRFVEINFKYDIRSWIKESLIPFSQKRDNDLMLSALYQYSDYLDRMFDDGNNNEEKTRKIMDTLNECGIGTLSKLKETIDELFQTYQELERVFKVHLSEQVNLHIMEPLKEYSKTREAGIELKWHEYSALELRMSIPGLSLSSFCFSDKLIGICSNEGNGVDQIEDKTVFEKLLDKGYTIDYNNKWWLAYKTSPINNTIGTLMYWEELVPNHTIVKCIEQCYEEIVSIVCGESE